MGDISQFERYLIKLINEGSRVIKEFIVPIFSAMLFLGDEHWLTNDDIRYAQLHNNFQSMIDWNVRIAIRIRCAVTK